MVTGKTHVGLLAQCKLCTAHGRHARPRRTFTSTPLFCLTVMLAEPMSPVALNLMPSFVTEIATAWMRRTRGARRAMLRAGLEHKVQPPLVEACIAQAVHTMRWHARCCRAAWTDAWRGGRAQLDGVMQAINAKYSTSSTLEQRALSLTTLAQRQRCQCKRTLL
jgi:hypothetical protein